MKRILGNIIEIVNDAGEVIETVRLPGKQARRIEALAAAEGVSVKAKIGAMLERGLERLEAGDIQIRPEKTGRA